MNKPFLHMRDLSPGDVVRKRANPNQAGTVVQTGFVDNMVKVDTPLGVRYWYPRDLEKIDSK